MSRKNVVIITARQGPNNKNMTLIYGMPIVFYPILAALKSPKVDTVYVSTDSEDIRKVAGAMDCGWIERPVHLRGDNVNHGDVIRDCVEFLERGMCPDLQIVTILLGNTVMITPGLITESIETLEENPDIDSVMSVWEAQDDHPMRALQINDNGLLETYGNEKREAHTNRQSYPKAYFYDQGVWTFRKDCVKKKSGPSPWWWMGSKCKPIIRPWVTGRDIHGPLDIEISEYWVRAKK